MISLEMKRIIRHYMSPTKILVKDSEPIENIKKKYAHSERILFYGNKRYVADCLYCHAAPGTFEICIEQLLNSLKTHNNRLLNLGGGSGQVTSILKEIGFDVVNVDIELEKIDSRNIRYNLNSNETLELNNILFDFVLCQEVIEHIENPWRLFRLMNKVLKVGGRLLLTTPNIQSSCSKRIFKNTGYFHWFTPECLSYHINPIPIWEIELIARKTGFESETLSGNTEYYFKNKKKDRKTILDNCENLIVQFQKLHDMKE